MMMSRASLPKAPSPISTSPSTSSRTSDSRSRRLRLPFQPRKGRKMNLFSKYSPMPGFPGYRGPYKVGSSDFEVPVSSLASVASSPDDTITTVQYRVFYPCESEGRESYVRWLNAPQRANVQAFATFMGAGNVFAHLFSYFPHLFYLANIPARRNACPLEPNTSSSKWPVVIFSHGLAGSRNSYSEICGSLASYGMVVFAPEHRDGSAPISFQKSMSSGKLKPVYYRPASHKPTPETYQHRDEQLRIRLWELGLVHDAVARTHKGNLPIPAKFCDSNREHGELLEVLQQLQGRLDIEPGRIVFAGHSFGAATTVQFIKSVFYRNSSDSQDLSYLYSPNPNSGIVHQITPATPTILLDMWCLPLKSPSTTRLWAKPLPCYTPSGPGGSTVLCVLSETFVKWRENLLDNKLACSENPQDESALVAPSQTQPNFCYPVSSAHLSQSDFGILFPNVTRLAFKTGDPELAIDLNVRAILQTLREHSYEVASTSKTKLSEYSDDGKVASGLGSVVDGGSGDWRILSKTGGVRGWKHIDLAPNSAVDSDGSGSGSGSDNADVTRRWKEPQDAVVEGEVLGEVRAQEA